MDTFCCTDNLALWSIRTKNLYFDGDELRVVDCMAPLLFRAKEYLASQKSYVSSCYFLHLQHCGMTTYWANEHTKCHDLHNRNYVLHNIYPTFLILIELEYGYDNWVFR